MARLFVGEKSKKEDRIQRLLRQHSFGLCETEVAQELGWERRTMNNYLRALKQRGHIYKEGRYWFAEY